jgi:AcrR family transcriptional regulator
MELFWAKGYADTSLADLTQAMEINSPSLYAAFGDKETLFREAARLYQKTEGGALWKPMEADGLTARQAFEGLLMATADAHTRVGKPSGCMVVLSGAHPDALPGGACRELQTIREATLEAMEDRLRQGRDAGEIASGADLAAMAAFYATVHQGMVFRARDGATPDELRGTARGAMMAWDGLAGLVPA